MKYRKKPIIIEAIQYTGTIESFDEVSKFVGDSFIPYPFMISDNREVGIHTLEGDHIVSINDYVIKGVKDEFYPCKPDIFEQTYEEVK